MLLYILACILILLSFLLFMKVRLIIGYDDDFTFKVKYIFFTFSIKSKGTGKAKKKKEEKKKPDKIQTAKKFINNFGTIADLLKTTFSGVLKRIRIDLFNLEFSAGGEDAADAAMTFGRACAVLYPAVSFIEQQIPIKKKHVSISAAFGADQSTVKFECIAGMRLGSVIAVVLRSGFSLVKSMAVNMLSKKRPARRHQANGA